MALAGTDSDRTSDSLHRTLVSKSLSSSRSFSAFFLVHFWRGIFHSPSSFLTVLSASYLCGHVCYSGVLRHFLEHKHLTKADREVLTRTLFIDDSSYNQQQNLACCVPLFQFDHLIINKTLVIQNDTCDHLGIYSFINEQSDTPALVESISSSCFSSLEHDNKLPF